MADVGDEHFNRVLEWLIRERTEYQQTKFDYGKWDDDSTKAFDKQKYPYDKMKWILQIENYLYRAYTLGIDTAGGRQALAKAAATVVAMTESAMRVYGDLPEPGVPSGELREWS